MAESSETVESKTPRDAAADLKARIVETAIDLGEEVGWGNLR